MNLHTFSDVFLEQLGAHAEHLFFAPGRVNLIGEHLDYNGGHVFPCALNIGTYAWVRRRADQQLNMYSLNFSEQGVHRLRMDEISYQTAQDWANYPAGMLHTMQSAGAVMPHGLDILFYGNIPNGAGLSSSASIEMLTAVLAQFIYQLPWSQKDLVRLAQRSENEFNGLNCGIMDMFASGMGRAGHAMLLNTQTLTYEHVPIDLGGNYLLLIANSHKRRDLNESHYNQRRAECEAALQQLQTVVAIEALCDLTPEGFIQHQHVIQNTIHLKRARHAIMENARTLQAVAALKNHDVPQLGQLMNESHQSLRDDFQVTGVHLDALVEAAWQHGAIGARMTGAGFGGCTIMLVEQSHLSVFCSQVKAQYKAQTGLSVGFYPVQIDEGARLLSSKGRV
ncbi:MAG: galactokinase [Formosimonas sp.]